MLDMSPGEGARTVRDCLMHIASVEWWYITRLEISLPDLPDGPFERLRIARRLAAETLSDLPRDRLGGIYQPPAFIAANARVSNLWTARKVLRRIVDHERLHTRYIARVLANSREVASPDVHRASRPAQSGGRSRA